MDEKNIQEVPFKGIFLEKYKKIRKQKIKEKRIEFSKQKSKIRIGIEKEIEKDQKHRDLVNMCIFPFCSPGKVTKLGYRFIMAEPLAELGAKNFDFLIYNKENNVALFGEVKGSVSDPRRTVSETEERIDIVKEHMEYISENYLGELPSYVEYIIGLYAADDEKVIREIHRRESRIIVWSIDRYNSILSPKTLRDDEKMAIKVGVLHRDASLINAVKNVKTSHKVFEIFSSSHIFSLMRIILLAKTTIDEGDLILTEKDLMEFVKGELSYLDNSTQEKKVKIILNMAESIGFLRRIDAETFKIVSRSKMNKSLEKDLKRKYVKYTERKQLRTIIEEATFEAQKEVEEERERVSLEKWL
ncbi:MAG: hypothetical protein HXS44_10270 [Theionarchaea archaeon]|nr:hypothetical protein [Theionarchaea archaeon]